MCLALFGCETGEVKKETKNPKRLQQEQLLRIKLVFLLGFDSDGGKACEDDAVGCLRTVNFAFDSSALDQKAQDILE